MEKPEIYASTFTALPLQPACAFFSDEAHHASIIPKSPHLNHANSSWYVLSKKNYIRAHIFKNPSKTRQEIPGIAFAKITRAAQTQLFKIEITPSNRQSLKKNGQQHTSKNPDEQPKRKRRSLPKRL